MIGALAQTEMYQLVKDFGPAGLVAAMWLVELARSRKKDTQIEQRESKILEDSVKIKQLVQVVQENSTAFQRLTDKLDERPCLRKLKGDQNG